MTLFKNRFRIESLRLPGWDYSSDGWYFVTICAKDRQCFFGEIRNGEMTLSGMGKIAYNEWKRTEIIRNNVRIDEFVIMPNHVHVIVIIENNHNGNCRNALQHVSTIAIATTISTSSYKNRFGPQRNNLSSIIRGYKGSVTRKIHESGYENFAWQSRFYDHIIRNNDSLNRIRNYIKSNPLKWNAPRGDALPRRTALQCGPTGHNKKHFENIS